MILNYFSAAHIIYILIAAAFTASAYFILRKVSERTQRIAVLSLMCLNVIQHLFKLYIYPQYDGGFNALSSAYNMCALLILASPIAYLLPYKGLRTFILYMGSAAGAVAILIPYWNIGDPAFSAETVRFLICHILLLMSSLLPLLLGHHRPSWRAAFSFPLGFFASLVFIIINDIIFITMGLYPTLSASDLYASLLIANPVWSFGPPPGAFAFIAELVTVISPSPFLPAGNPAGLYVPILWYFIPVYLGMMLLGLPIFALSDRANFLADMRSLGAKLSCAFSKLKSIFKKG